MARECSGEGRMNLFTLIWDWPTQSKVVIGYTSMGYLGSTAVMGIIPTDREGEPGDLFGIAGRLGFIGEWKGTHEQRAGCSLVCMGSGAVVVPKPGTIRAEAVRWSMIGATQVALAAVYCGHDTVIAGRMSLADKDLEARALSVLR